MPPKRKNNKQKQMIRKKQITMSLMAISLQVDKYIYKNKPISISQAQMYLEELTSFRSQCLGDAPSLQVCEKLTRCIRGIIEEQKSNDAVLEETDTFIEPNNSSCVHAASPVYSLVDEDITQMASESELMPDIQSKDNKYNACINKSNISEDLKENNDGPRKTVRFCIDDNAEVNKTHKIKANFDHSYGSNTNQQCNVDNGLTNAIVDLTLEDIEQPITIDEDLCSQSLLKNLESNETHKTFGKDSSSQSILTNLEMNEKSQIYDEFINDTCGQDMEEYDREIINLLEPVQGSKEYTKKRKRTTPSIAQIIQNTQETVTIPHIIKAPEIAETGNDNFGNLETKNLIKNNQTKDVKVQKKKTAKNNNKENKPQKKRGIKKANSKTGNDANTRAFTPLTNNYEVTLQASNPIINSNNTFNIVQANVKKIEMRTDPNILATFATNCSLNTVQTAEQSVSTIKSTKIVCIDDLSWVENLTYVREIHLEEYDPGLKPNSESFWDNCELPDNWDGRDFEWT